MSTVFTAKHPDYDATVAIEIRNGIIQFDFLAQGRSQKKKDGKVVGYSKRNPERRLLFLHVVEYLTSEPTFTVTCVGVASGQGSPFRAMLATGLEDAVGHYRKGKTFRFRMFIQHTSTRAFGPRDLSSLPGAWGTAAPKVLAELMGLVHAPHKPVTTEWYGLDS